MNIDMVAADEGSCLTWPAASQPTHLCRGKLGSEPSRMGMLGAWQAQRRAAALSSVQSHLVHVAQCSGNIKCNRTTRAHRHERSECFQLISDCTCATPGFGCGGVQADAGCTHRQRKLPSSSTIRRALHNTGPESASAALCRGHPVVAITSIWWTALSGVQPGCAK